MLRVTRILFDDNDRPIALEEAVLPLDRLPGLSPNGGVDIPDIIEIAQRHGISLGRAMERISIVPSTREIAQHLGIAAGADVMKLDRIVETIDGVPGVARCLPEDMNRLEPPTPCASAIYL